jgi:uncharacterized membrane protein YhaH (DUF805 family)
MKAITAFETLLIAHGRLNRQNYLIVMATLAIPAGILMGTSEVLPVGAWHWLIVAIWLSLYVIAIFPIVRRWHDMNKSGKYWWLMHIPIVGIVFGCMLLFVRGTRGPNTYGPDPLGEIGEQAEAELRVQALSEVESNERESSTWAQALQESQGNQDQAKARYIALRVLQLSKERYREQVSNAITEVDERLQVLNSEISEIEALVKKGRVYGEANKLKRERDSLKRRKKVYSKYFDEEDVFNNI